MKKLFFQLVSGFIVVLGLAACHPRPLDDLAIADVALKAAQKVKADSLAPDFFRKAENFYLRAKKDFADGYFDSSKKFAGQARLMAEKAEYRALQRQSQMKTKVGDEEPAGTTSEPFKPKTPEVPQ
jgi:hypothetical protein